MSVIVQKFGGTSVADIYCFRRAAEKVVTQVELGQKVVVIVSAMGGETNRLIDLTKELSLAPDAAEYDVVTSSGEQVSCGLFSIALQEKGIKARSALGWQVPLETCETHSRARYKNILDTKIHDIFKTHDVVVIPGFQGISPSGRVTTLGRGGSDITAVATAAALNVDRCDIFTDVPGVFTADPRIVKSARLLEKISYPEMLELSSHGAKVLQTRAVAMAMNNKVNLRVLSSFEDGPGTLVLPEEEIMENGVVKGITHSSADVFITLKGVEDKAGTGAKIFSPLAKGNVSIDMIAHHVNGFDQTDLSFTIAEEDLERGKAILASSQNDIGFKDIYVNTAVCKVTIVGSGLKNHPKVISQAFEAFAKLGINIYKTATSEVKLSFLIPQEYAELAMRTLHAEYELDKPE